VVIADASVLITLAKTRRIGLLKTLYGEVIIGPVVRAEVVDRGRELKAPEVRLVEKAIRESWLKEVLLTPREKNLARRLLRDTNLDQGEVECLALAHFRKLTALIDDKEARMIAESMGLKRLGTVGILLEALSKGYMTYSELEEGIRDLGKVMWLAPDVVAEVLRIAREVEK
jgi:predicted nucleic acid-binding protein